MLERRRTLLEVAKEEFDLANSYAMAAAEERLDNAAMIYGRPYDQLLPHEKADIDRDMRRQNRLRQYLH